MQQIKREITSETSEYVADAMWIWNAKKSIWFAKNAKPYSVFNAQALFEILSDAQNANPKYARIAQSCKRMITLAFAELAMTNSRNQTAIEL